MATLIDCTDHTSVSTAIRQSMVALERGEVIVVPTDTVYGLAVSPKSPGAIDRLVGLKGRERTTPPPFLIGTVEHLWPLLGETANTAEVLALIDHFWPGALTIVLPVNPALDWDIGETGGTIAVRMPNEEVLLDLLQLSGPLAVTSANLTGQPPVENADEALQVFGERVGVYLDAGTRSSNGGDQIPSTIIDVVDLARGGTTIRVIREGAISSEQLSQVVPGVVIQ